MSASANFEDVVVYNTTDVFEFEKNFDVDIFFSWMVRNWTLSFWYSAAYVIIIFAGKRYMENRPRFDLRVPLIIWSGILGAFSIAGAVRTIPEMAFMISNYGFRESVCNPSYIYGPTSFWGCLFVVSKVYELGDTIFIVLRKQPLIFLHWYHHITVLIYVWYSYIEHTSPGRWFEVMNYTVHAFMYSYYCLKAMRFYIPKWVSMIITSLQLMQMIVGILINYLVYAHYKKENGLPCQQSLENLQYSTLMYTSYFVLFAHFFYNAYLSPKAHKPNKKHQNGILSEETISYIAKKTH